MKKNILNAIAAFFKSLGPKGASGEPVNEDWASRQAARSQEKEPAQDNLENDKHIELSIDLTEEPVTIETTDKSQESHSSAKELEEVSLAPELVALQKQYAWRLIKAKEPLTVKPLPEPFSFIDKDKKAVLANRSEISFIKELLTKAAEAGIENRFSFALSVSREIIVKYRNRTVGRVFLQSRKHRMVFKRDGNTFIAENLTLAQCKKLLLIWLGQIKEKQTEQKSENVSVQNSGSSVAKESTR